MLAGSLNECREQGCLCSRVMAHAWRSVHLSQVCICWMCVCECRCQPQKALLICFLSPDPQIGYEQERRSTLPRPPGCSPASLSRPVWGSGKMSMNWTTGAWDSQALAALLRVRLGEILAHAVQGPVPCPAAYVPPWGSDYRSVFVPI